MTDAKKPIELHLVGQENFTIFASLDSAEQAQELVSSIRRSNQPCYLHVIEKSAYDKLLARVEKLREGLKQFRTDKIAIELLKQDDEAKNE